MEKAYEGKAVTAENIHSIKGRKIDQFSNFSKAIVGTDRAEKEVRDRALASIARLPVLWRPCQSRPMLWRTGQSRPPHLIVRLVDVVVHPQQRQAVRDTMVDAAVRDRQLDLMAPRPAPTW